VVGCLLVMYVVVSWFQSPELTEMQLFLEYWRECIGSVVLLGTARFLWQER